ncbi:MAG TPA: helix-turn-helix domain-containing protein, partial [Anaerovoracaceae bacterium]|nr:helix-turn-helix domain-containing protein [Anaerovoracaceae bacterium]
MNLREFGIYFAKIREESGFDSQRQLADISGVSHSTINRLEAGTHKTSIEKLQVLARFLKGVNANELIERAGYLDQNSLSSRLHKAADDAKNTDATLEQSSGLHIDPEVNVFFKDFASAPKEKQEEMLRFWEFI